MQTLTVPVWLWAVLAWLAVSGFTTWCWVVAGWAERAADWWHERRKPRADEDCEHEYTPNEAGTHEWCQKCDSIRPTLLELPPERTWDQMTSHQLPLERQLVSELERQGWFDADVQSRLRAEYEARHAPERERRAPWWEIQQRAAYESLGLDYPSGLMARVRELTP